MQEEVRCTQERANAMEAASAFLETQDDSDSDGESEPKLLVYEEGAGCSRSGSVTCSHAGASMPLRPSCALEDVTQQRASSTPGARQLSFPRVMGSRKSSGPPSCTDCSVQSRRRSLSPIPSPEVQAANVPTRMSVGVFPLRQSQRQRQASRSRRLVRSLSFNLFERQNRG